MFWIMVALFFLGFLLILLEVAVPHGLSIIAGLALMISASVIIMKTEGIGRGLVFLILGLGLAGFASYHVYRSGIR